MRRQALMPARKMITPQLDDNNNNNNHSQIYLINADD